MNSCIELGNGMSLGNHVLDWKKDDFVTAFKDAKKKDADGKWQLRYNAEDIWKRVQAYKTANKKEVAEAKKEVATSEK